MSFGPSPVFRRPTSRALAATVLVCCTASACGSSTSQGTAHSGNHQSGNHGQASICGSLASLDHALKETSQQVKSAPKDAANAVKSLEEQFHAFQQKLQQQAPHAAAALDQAMKQVDKAGTSASGAGMHNAAKSLEQELSSVRDLVNKAESKVGC